MTIHFRKSEKEVVNILIKNNIRNAIMHWYTGPINLIDDFIKSEYYFPINPSMLTSISGCKILNKIPLGRILIESDGPIGKISGKKIKPNNISLIYELIWKKLNIDNIDEVVLRNFKTLLKKKYNLL